MSRDPGSNRTEPGIALEELNHFSENLCIPDAVRDEAARICVSSLERGLARRRPLAQIAASSLYVASREKGVPVALEDVVSASGVSKKELARCYRMLVNELELRIPVAGTAECLARVASRAMASRKVEEDARDILSKADEAGITAGAYPSGLAASALYLASLLDGEWMTQTRAAEAAGVKETTVRRESKRLRKVLGLHSGGTTRTKRRSSDQIIGDECC